MPGTRILPDTAVRPRRSVGPATRLAAGSRRAEAAVYRACRGRGDGNRAEGRRGTDNILPPVEQVRPGLWSIPVPIPDNPLRYVLVYALELDGGGVAIVDAGWDTDEAWGALTDGPGARPAAACPTSGRCW